MFTCTFSYSHVFTKMEKGHIYCPGSSCESIPWTSFQDSATPSPDHVTLLASPSRGSTERIICLGHYCWVPSPKQCHFFLEHEMSFSSLPLAGVYMGWEVILGQVSPADILGMAENKVKGAWPIFLLSNPSPLPFPTQWGKLKLSHDIELILSSCVRCYSDFGTLPNTARPDLYAN